MQRIFIEETDISPKIVLDYEKGEYIIKGFSISSDAFNMYQPVWAWFEELEKVIPVDKELKVQIHLEHINTSSSKMLFEIFEVLKKIESKGCKIEVDWYHYEEDEEHEEGSTFEEISELKFNFIPIDESYI